MSNTNEPIRWTIYRACIEFGVSKTKLKSRLAATNAMPEGGTYSTAQICAAIYSDYDMERLRLMREQADKLAFDNAERRESLITVADAKELTKRFADGLRKRFVALALTDAEKAGLMQSVSRLENADFTQVPDQDDPE